ncbi:hypothetical protein LPJ73_001296 [Coemansia sp. RSA 2703]|nr:hypothetical protein LPJ73_001296 [Coemansia sp. RSA 2703]KAJ2377536.1 hypothetical protein IW150_001331 [Coemansia sp. RSA 2607]KAJ2383304.1 hypothetical protein GGI05_005361 [Coemansia sp. RSA 2603]
MQFAVLMTVFAAAVMASPATEASDACTKACSVAPTDQHESCLRICAQFAEQGVPFSPATATPMASPMATPAMHASSVSPMASGSAKHTASMMSGMKSGSMMSASGSMDMKSKGMGGEDNDEDHEGMAKSGGSSAEFSGATKASVGVGAAVLALAALF